MGNSIAKTGKKTAAMAVSRIKAIYLQKNREYYSPPQKYFVESGVVRMVKVCFFVSFMSFLRFGC